MASAKYLLKHNGREIDVWQRRTLLEGGPFRMLTEMAVRGEAHEWGEVQGRKHIERVGRSAGRMAAGLGMDKGYCETISFAATLHDIGKLFCPPSGISSWYCKDRGLREKAASHALRGGAYLNSLNPMGGGLLGMAAEIALNHHEAWNGNGFPHGRSEKFIPLAARIVAIVDFYDTCTYLGGEIEVLNKVEVTELLRAAAGEYFDPALVRLFITQSEGCYV
ncbi:Response regulator containing a CheY-like receiver domain and an HD-GYP domain [Pseudomonas sp. LAMO17WK12:I10]|uniref:HD-GYP domain-containing protein n=1 Tax=unclassified Pseudomonas TaxID=196821 RepID=UPI000BD8404F|nr:MULTISPECIES: HD domain-containing phosphohydrolase [unclassified Pseudomonas]PXX49824.1 putative two-component system response regulator [Pseudomonas sp. LAMO17WK12:I9]SNY54387.1 Response regulator containing a CheY-like receiver domain and an HD-GYP domain [Pseudomonas sp. LAMO17WK12:I10]